MNPIRVAIIGSGPSGFYAADALLKQTTRPVQVDMFDRLPTPYGLVRGGVAPDHQSIKGVIKAYDKVAANPNFRFFGNVALGRDFTVADLAALYDQWVYAVGAEQDRRLGIRGEDLVGSHSATEFVGWYNAHPDHAHHAFDLSAERVAIVGVGNVAMDVTRILAQDANELAATDIADYAVVALRHSKVREIYVLGRRGVAQAAFSPAEIKEIGELANADVVVDPADVVIDPLSEPELADPNTKKNVDFCTACAARGEGDKPKKVRLKFLASPVEILGVDGKVTAIRVERNRLEAGANGPVAKGTGVIEEIPVGLVFRSVGYKGVAVPDVPYDERSGTIPNIEGRVVEAATRALRPREYVVGWAKRGPSGLIGTNRGDSIATVNAMVADWPTVPGLGAAPDAVIELLRSRNAEPTSFADWKLLDGHEQAQGKASGKLREKVVRVADMVAKIKELRA
jgi:ferredoxin--NADP+ reductase